VPAWSACILAGGRGRRLAGRIKPLIEVDGRTILARQVEMLASLGVRPTLVAPDPLPFVHTGLLVVPDAVTAGALGALFTALHQSETPNVLVLAGDLPFVTASFVTYLASLMATHDAVVPRSGERWQPLCAMYHRRVAGHLHEAIVAGNWRVADTLSGLDVHAVTGADLARFDADERLLLNVNTPDDYLRADPRAVL
jgi:molybdenum cofactor guanylyltransferase